MTILYHHNIPLDVTQVIDLFHRSTLGERRPTERPEIFAAMLQHANLVITAWQQEQLIGIARSLSDFAYVTYLADLAVDRQWQRRGIGKRLLAETRQRIAPSCQIVLLAAPKANDYYAGLGFEHNPRAWILPPEEKIQPK
ncbi:MAG: GNAT family N-acetyltransferase [Magnetococcales bacterium]|nr:GNAT family N-acetyltransferase [Magnetococcales bacterium]